MARPKKVKRYKSIYRGSSYRRATPIGIAATVLGVVLLAVVGWSLYEPVYNFLMGNIQPSTSSSSSQAPGGEPSEEPSAPSEPTSEVPPEAPATGAIRGVYMPTAVLQNQSLRTGFLDGLADTGINAVLFELKDVAGGVTYRSALSAVADAKAQQPGAVELSQVVEELRTRGLLPMGRIHAFKDPLAAAGITGSQVRYQDTEWTWLDNSPELGGKPWLNPFSPQAQGYILDLVEEAGKAGVEELIIDSIHFPTGVALDKASYGQASGPAQRTTALRDFATAAQERARQSGARAQVYLSIPALLGSEGERYGNNPAAIPGGSVALGAFPSLFGNAFSSAELELESPVLSPYDTVKKALSAAAAKLGGQTGRVVLLQAYTATNVDPLHNRAYTGEDVQNQLRALAELGEESYILYSPQGSYPQGSFPESP